jgi:CubicO group peptidase (beta-lactamase class C family)
VAARLRDGEVEVAAAGPVEPDAVFELGSITKAVTGLLLADALVRGEVALAMAAAVALALTPRAGRGPIKAGLGWMHSPLARDTDLWWHNGGTHGSRSFTGFVPATSAAVAVLTNSPKAPDGLARRLLAGHP